MIIPSTEKVLGFLVAVVVSLAGVAYAGVTARIVSLEQDRSDLSSVAREIAIATAVSKTQVEALQENTQVMRVRLEDLSAAQRDSTQRLNEIMRVMSQNTRDYQAALARWEEILDRITKSRQ
jgi:biopolymer transport protein ExbB/TolQ